MRPRLFILSSLLLIGMPLAAISTHFAAVTLPFLPAAVIASLSCGGTAAVFVWNLSKLLGL